MKLYNSLSQTKELFIPNNDKKVMMYVCGITPYDTTHLGHAFTYTFFDVLQRHLTYKGYTVIYTQNVTDIDDDMLKKAKSVKQDWKELGEFWTQKYLTDMKTLNNLSPNFYVKATDTIPTIIEIITDLEEKGLAYEKDGIVFFRTQKDAEYGKLSRYTREQMLLLSKERGANPDDPRKEDPLDFILWQKSLPDEPFWESPWGNGRPGWHIECSAMIDKYLYKYIDIHGGGHDLIYPHHESEIAQSESFTGKKPFVKYWLHTGAVMYQGEKMSKSLGNLVMVSDLLRLYKPAVIRYLLLTHHYRQPWEFEESQLDEAQQQITLLTQALQKEIPTKHTEDMKEIITAFTTALDDDINTPKAIEILMNVVQEQLTTPSKIKKKTLKEMRHILGLPL